MMAKHEKSLNAIRKDSTKRNSNSKNFQRILSDLLFTENFRKHLTFDNTNSHWTSRNRLIKFSRIRIIKKQLYAVYRKFSGNTYRKKNFSKVCDNQNINNVIQRESTTN